MIAKARFKFSHRVIQKFIRRGSLKFSAPSIRAAYLAQKFKHSLHSSKDKILRVCIANIKFRAHRHHALLNTILAVPHPRLMTLQTLIKLCDTILPAICAAARTKTQATIARGRRNPQPKFRQGKTTASRIALKFQRIYPANGRRLAMHAYEFYASAAGELAKI